MPVNDTYAGEISLDAEMAIAMAPAVQVVLFEGGDYSLILDAMASSSNIAQFTSSVFLQQTPR